MSQIVFPSSFLEMVYGLLLGDGWLIKVGNHARLGIDQKHKELTYNIWYKCKEIGIVGSEPRESIRNRKEGTFVSYQFFTVTLPLFTDLYSKWYKKDQNKIIKILPYDIKDFITPISLAYWITGDGTFKKSNNQIILCTNNFTKQEVELLVSILFDKFNINSTIQTRKNGNKMYYLISISSKDTHKIQNLVIDHLPKCMLYRVGL